MPAGTALAELRTAVGQEQPFGFVTEKLGRPRKADIADNERVQEVLAKPFPGTVAQGVVLVFLKDFR